MLTILNVIHEPDQHLQESGDAQYFIAVACTLILLVIVISSFVLLDRCGLTDTYPRSQVAPCRMMPNPDDMLK